jgi:hypothetical protein
VTTDNRIEARPILSLAIAPASASAGLFLTHQRTTLNILVRSLFKEPEITGDNLHHSFFFTWPAINPPYYKFCRNSSEWMDYPWRRSSTAA